MVDQKKLSFEQPLRALEEQVEGLRQKSEASQIDFSEEIRALEAKIAQMRQDIYKNLSIWERVQLSRHPKRPYFLDYVSRIFTDFQELHGDRRFGDDLSTICGFARLDGRPVALVGQQKGRNVKENILRNFGSPQPEGYRKAMRVMEMASQFGVPIVTFIDTPGAFPGVGSEERHVAEAIAVNIRDMSRLRVPTVGVVIGEGGSGGALGIGVVDRLLVLENAYYSVISPEGCAAILWKDRAKASDAATALRLDPYSLVKFGIADEVVPEPIGGAQEDYDAIAATVKSLILKHLGDLGQTVNLERRYKKYRKIGVFSSMKGSE